METGRLELGPGDLGPCVNPSDVAAGALCSGVISLACAGSSPFSGFPLFSDHLFSVGEVVQFGARCRIAIG